MSAEEKLSVFGDFDPSEHEEEAERRWGSTDAYAQSARRTAQYTKDDWRAIQDEATEIYGAFAALIGAGTRPGSPDATAVVERHREHISRWFYDCTPEIHAGLGQMYVPGCPVLRDDRSARGRRCRLHGGSDRCGVRRLTPSGDRWNHG